MFSAERLGLVMMLTKLFTVQFSQSNNTILMLLELDGVFGMLQFLLQGRRKANSVNLPKKSNKFSVDHCLKRWIYRNKVLFVKKTVLEVGSGPGLCGLVASLHADKVVLSDNNNTILDLIKENIRLNGFIILFPFFTQFKCLIDIYSFVFLNTHDFEFSNVINKSKCYVTLIDWKSKQVVSSPPFLKEGVDIIIGMKCNTFGLIWK
jgi:tRNA G26 N,N-dimethylase Trm1